KHSCDLGIKLYNCDQCQYETSALTHLKRHKVNIHQLDTEYLRCDFCDYKTFDKYHLKEHIHRKHTSCEDTEWLNCTQFNYKTKIRVDLNRHVRKHTVSNRGKFICEHCEYVTISKRDLKRHILYKHTDDADINWFNCD